MCTQKKLKAVLLNKAPVALLTPSEISITHLNYNLRFLNYNWKMCNNKPLPRIYLLTLQGRYEAII